ELRRLRALRTCLLVPARESGFVRAVVVAHGRVAVTRTVPLGGGAVPEIDAALAEAAGATHPESPSEDAEPGVGASFLRRPPPELRVLPLEREAILAAVAGR